MSVCAPTSLSFVFSRCLALGYSLVCKYLPEWFLYTASLIDLLALDSSHACLYQSLSSVNMFSYIFVFICAFLRMGESLRDTPLGQFMRYVGFKSYLRYPEEMSNFQAPSFATVLDVGVPSDVEPKQHVEQKRKMSEVSISIDTPEKEIIRRISSKNITSAILVTWYAEDDPENPRNWSNLKKRWTIFIMCLHTFVVYCAASIITPTAEYVMHEYSISIDVASLGLSLYIVGYAIGPMFFSPISEIPLIGRNPPYLYSFAIFFILSIVMSVVKSFPAIVVLRFLQGLFGSPVLASGSGTIEDMYEMFEAPYPYILWIAAMYCGPALGPLLPAWAVADDWRWALWITVIMAGIVLLLLPLMPETSPTKIILQRARRLRLATGNPSYLAPSEITPLNFGTTLKSALLKPTEISIKDPAIAFTVVYVAIVYATYYSFFEVFPVVYLQHYGMPLWGLGLIFTGGICGGCLIGMVLYHAYIRHHFLPRALHHYSHHNAPPAPETWLHPGLLGSLGPPLGLFLFAYTASTTPEIHWLVPTTGIAIFSAGSFAVFQSLICYIALSYPKYMASLFAANDFVRGLAAAGMVAGSRYMYEGLGVQDGVVLVAGLSCLGVVGLWVLWWCGEGLRRRSRFTGE